jgi:hypothetical protein
MGNISILAAGASKRTLDLPTTDPSVKPISWMTEQAGAENLSGDLEPLGSGTFSNYCFHWLRYSNAAKPMTAPARVAYGRIPAPLRCHVAVLRIASVGPLPFYQPFARDSGKRSSRFSSPRHATTRRLPCGASLAGLSATVSAIPRTLCSLLAGPDAALSRPSLARLVVAENGAACLMHVLGQVGEVQTDRIQGQVLAADLVADPDNTVGQRDLHWGPVQGDPCRFPAHQSSRDLAVAAAYHDVAMGLGFVVIGDDLELLVILVRSGPAGGKDRHVLPW